MLTAEQLYLIGANKMINWVFFWEKTCQGNLLLLVVINFLQESGGVVELRIIAIGLLGGKVHKSGSKKSVLL